MPSRAAPSTACKLGVTGSIPVRSTSRKPAPAAGFRVSGPAARRPEISKRPGSTPALVLPDGVVDVAGGRSEACCDLAQQRLRVPSVHAPVEDSLEEALHHAVELDEIGVSGQHEQVGDTGARA